jgi:hypothetical protein
MKQKKRREPMYQVQAVVDADVVVVVAKDTLALSH